MAANSAMYAQKLADAGVEPADIRSIDDLGSLPVVTKEDMSRSVAANSPRGDYTAVDDQVWKETGWQLFQTSGTTAAPRAFRYTQRDRELWAWANARAVYAMGIRSGRDVGMMLFGYGPHVAMWGLHHALLLMGVPQLPVGGMDTRARAAMIDRLEPTVLGCTPSYALHLGAVMTDMAIDPARTAVRILIVMGEPTPPSTRRRIEEPGGPRSTSSTVVPKWRRRVVATHVRLVACIFSRTRMWSRMSIRTPGSPLEKDSPASVSSPT